jgi:Zn-dependent peptidase ImmA (M78 family)
MTPLIQLSSRYKRNDIFWFSFFHEIGHILLHGKKDVFLESVDYQPAEKEKEAEANAFAVKWTLSAQEEAIVMASDYTDEVTIVALAQQFGTHPAIIIGRLQHLRVIKHTDGQPFFVRGDLGD